MNTWVLFTRTSGRVSRQTFWSGILTLGTTAVVGMVFVQALIGTGFSASTLLGLQHDPRKFAEFVTSQMQTSGWVMVMFIVVLAYPGYCVMVKRRHDRGSYGRGAFVYLTGLIVLGLMLATGHALEPDYTSGLPMPALPFVLIGGAVHLYGFYLLIVLGFLKGESGPNRYGPDPLAPDHTDGVASGRASA